MNDVRIVNYTPKNIREFVEGDTIYISKMKGGKGGYQFIYYCKFIGFKRGIVRAEIIDCDSGLSYGEKGTEITARLTKCLLWGNDGTSTICGKLYDRCYWFTKEGTVK